MESYKSRDYLKLSNQRPNQSVMDIRTNNKYRYALPRKIILWLTCCDLLHLDFFSLFFRESKKCGSGALNGKMLLVRIIGNDKIEAYFSSG